MKKKVLITGAAGSLGQVVTDQFLQRGYDVKAVVSSGKSSLHDEERPGLEILEADLTNELEAESIVTQIISKHGSIEAAVLLAGGYAGGAMAETDGAMLRRMFALNFETAFFIARPVFLQMMRQKSGRIILVGSRPSLDPNDGKNAVAYSLSKSLLFKLADLLNSEGERLDVVSSVVVPSTIDTPQNRRSMPQADHEKWVKAEEIAGLMTFIVESRSLRAPVFKIYGDA